MNEIIMDQPPWLLAKIDQLVARMKESGASKEYFDTIGIEVVLVMLTEPPEGATDDEVARWEASCDNCGRWSPRDLMSGSATRHAFGRRLLIGFGVCPVCFKESQ